MRTPEYIVWSNMVARCANKGDRWYGGRGINVCNRWRDFKKFLADMGPRPKGHQIDRIDVNGDYEPGNCHWVTRVQNARNKRSTRFATIGGVTKSTNDWAEEFGVPNYLVGQRIRRDGCTPEEALLRLHGRGPEAFHGIRRTTTFVVVDGERMPLIHACRKLGRDYKKIYQRIKRDKLSPEDALARP